MEHALPDARAGRSHATLQGDPGLGADNRTGRRCKAIRRVGHQREFGVDPGGRDRPHQRGREESRNARRENQDERLHGGGEAMRGRIPRNKRLLALGGFLLKQLFRSPQLSLENFINLHACALAPPRDLLPISLHQLVHENVLSLKDFGFYVDRAEVRWTGPSASGGGRQRRSRARAFSLRCWLLMQVHIFNRMFLAAVSPSKADVMQQQEEPRELSEPQLHSIHSLFRQICNFHRVPAPLGTIDSHSTLQALLQRADLGEKYGSKIYKAEDLDAQRVQLPLQAGICDVDSILFEAEGWLHNPALLIKKEYVKVKRVKVWASDSDWDEICLRSINCGLMTLVDEDEPALLDSSGAEVLCGAFAVPKTGMKDGLPDRRQRFIIQVPFNEMIEWGAVGASYRDPRLPYPSSLTLIALRDNEVLLSNSEDEENCFYLYRLPRAWARFLTFRKRYRGRRVALSCVPMGFVLSVGILQCLQRAICSLAGLPISREIRPDMPLPDMRRIDETTGARQSSYWSYIDNFDEFLLEVVDEADSEGDVFLKFNKHLDPEKVSDTTSFGELQKKIYTEKRRLGIPLNSDKRLIQATSFGTLGAFVDGHSRNVGVKVEKRQVIMIVIMFILFGQKAFSYHEMASVIGILNNCFLFQRPLFSILHGTYHWVQHFTGGHYIPKNVFCELFFACVCVQLAECQLDKRFDLRIHSSDASLHGGAFGSAPTSLGVLERLLHHCDARGTRVRVAGPSSELKSSRSLLKVASETERGDLTFRMGAQWKWKYGQQPIVILEGLAFLTQLKSLTRNIGIHSSRIFHIFDAESALGALCKGRSGSFRLNRTCRQVGALALCSQITCYYAFTESDSMPMDEASREFRSDLSEKEWKRDFSDHFTP